LKHGVTDQLQRSRRVDAPGHFDRTPGDAPVDDGHAPGVRAVELDAHTMVRELEQMRMRDREHCTSAVTIALRVVCSRAAFPATVVMPTSSPYERQ
jgi:hypothetical protein